MRRRQAIRIALLAGSILILFLAVAFGLWNREPIYHGKPFSYWLDQIPCTVTGPGFASRMYPHAYRTTAELEAHAQADRDNANEGLQAVTRIGSKCLPMLLRRMKSQDSQLKLLFVRWSTRLHLTAPQHFPSADTMRGQALTAILKLDSEAKPLLPALILLAQDKDSKIRLAARHAVRELSPQDFQHLQQLQQ